MKDDQGFTKKQKTELGEMFADLFKEVVLPSLEILSDRLDGIEQRLNKIETRLKSLEDKMDEVWAELNDLKRRIKDLEMSTVEMRSYLGLKARVEILEQRVGIAAL